MSTHYFSELTYAFQEISLQLALYLVSMTRVRTYKRTEERDRLIVGVFSDGLEVAWRSECDGPYSDVTPDLDWSPPTIWARVVGKEE